MSLGWDISGMPRNTVEIRREYGERDIGYRLKLFGNILICRNLSKRLNKGNEENILIKFYSEKR